MAVAVKQKVRFGPYELDVHSGELWKDGTRLKLQPQPIQVLAALLEHPGELVTREELQHRLWPNDTFVDFEQGLNTAIKKLRVALCDEAETPKYIETLPKRGYRFIAEVRFWESNHVVEQDPLAGRLLSHYRLVERIGEGGMGVVYRAHDERLDRDVALKILPEGSLEDEPARQRFRKEALALSKLNHPNIAMIFDFDSENGTDFLVEELVEGVSLNEMLTAGPLREKEIVQLASQLCEGLAAAHEHGIIHRDIKPANLRITSESHLKILDFGLAKTVRPPNQAAGETITVSEAQVVSGTLPYMSPEQLRNEKLDGRTDIWAVGCVLYEMATGRRPFVGEGSVVIDEILNQQPAQPSKLNHRVSPGLEAIIQKCMEKDAALRYRSARDILVDLRRLPQPVSSGSAPFPPLAARRRKWRWIEVVSALALIVLSIFVARSWFSTPPPRIVGYRRLTHTGLQKITRFPWFCYLATDGSRVYFQEHRKSDQWFVSQVSSAGGEESDVVSQNMTWPCLLGSSPSGSELLIAESQYWRVPLPVGTPYLVSLPRSEGLGGIHPRSGGLGNATWAPDGRSFVYAGPNTKEIYRLKIGGTTPQRLLGAQNAMWLRVSPDGRRIRWTEWTGLEGGQTDIWDAGIDGSDPHPLFPDMKGETFFGDWTNDGKLFFFYRRTGTSNSLWAIPEDSSRFALIRPRPTLLYAGPLELASPISSKDSKELFVVGAELRGELSVYDTKTSKFIPFLNGISACYVAFSPDRQWIVYVSYPDGALWKSRADGSEKMQLTFQPTGVVNPRWSPDGKFIVFTDFYAGEHHAMYLVPAEGGQPRILPSGSEPMDPTWSPDARYLVHDVSATSEPHIEMLDLQTMQSREIPDSEGLWSPRLSPNGKYIVAITARSVDPQMLVYSFAEEKWRPLLGVGRNGWQAWSQDSKYVYAHDRSKALIYRIDVESGKLETVVHLKGVKWTTFRYRYTGWFGLTPDNRIMILRDTGSEDIYALQLDY